jgi:diguanylate cyclase (GGDEF)-like protein/PAS domain S-box-containing protein
MTQVTPVAIQFARTPVPRLVSVDDTIHGLLGYTAQHFLSGSKQWLTLIHPDDQDIIDWLFSPELAPLNEHFNIRIRHADGRIRCIRGDYTLSTEAGQTPLLTLHLADARRLQLENTSLLTPNFVAMMENTDDFIYFKDRNHVLTGASQSLVAITAPSEHWTDLLGKTDYDVFPEEYADIYYRLEKKVFAGFSVAHEVQKYLANDGSEGWVDNRKYPIRDTSGEIVGLFGVARDITDIKRAEEALMESEHRFKTIFEQLPSISVQGYDRQRQVIFWNQASEALYGYSREQAMGRQLEDLIIPQPMREAVIGFVDAWTAGGAAIPAGELTLHGADGAPVEVFSSHVMVNNAHGEPEMYCIDINTSERNRAERGLRANETFLRTIIDEIPDPLMIKDHLGNFLLCNQALAKLYKVMPEAMIGKQVDDFGLPKDVANALRQNELSIMERSVTEVVLEDILDPASGEMRSYRSIKKPFKNASGDNQILVLAQDITDVIRAQQQVAESEQRLQHVMGITREGIWDWHLPSGKVLHNRQWFETLQYNPGDLPHTLDAFVAVTHPEDRKLVRQRVDDLINGTSDAYHSEHRLLRKDGQAIWVQDRGRVVERDAKGDAVRVVGSFTDISYQKAHQNYLERIAHYDPLTGLPNRVLLADRMGQVMAQAKRRGAQMAVAYLDLDGFKVINDRYDHNVGDQLLKELASHFKATLREGDTMARLGGDEFVAVFADLADVHDSIGLINRLLDVASRPTLVENLSLKVSASIGVSFYPQADDTDADQLLRQADQAMYSAKLAGKNRYHLFDAEHDRTLRVRNEAMERIRLALAQGEFVLHYQPKVNLRTGALVGAEALIRWQHPDLGMLAPGVFLPDIEGHALSVNVGEWVLDTALKQMEEWLAIGLDLPVSVNISAYHLQEHNFSDRLKTLLAAHPKVPRGHLELEVLETAALDELDQVAAVMCDCASLGVGFALDDFGTGYSSLTYLKRLPAQVLKIDQSFVRDMLDDPEDLAIVEGVLGLARAFRRQAVAEGAETTAHCKLLLEVGCELAQGYGIARPMPADQMVDWKAHWHPDPGWVT